jgi:hypothetical protein
MTTDENAKGAFIGELNELVSQSIKEKESGKRLLEVIT